MPLPLSLTLTYTLTPHAHELGEINPSHCIHICSTKTVVVVLCVGTHHCRGRAIHVISVVVSIITVAGTIRVYASANVFQLKTRTGGNLVNIYQLILIKGYICNYDFEFEDTIVNLAFYFQSI